MYHSIKTIILRWFLFLIKDGILLNAKKAALLLSNDAYFYKLKDIARQEHCGLIEGVVLAENTEALEFYEKFLNSKIISDRLHYMRLELDATN